MTIVVIPRVEPPSEDRGAAPGQPGGCFGYQVPGGSGRSGYRIVILEVDWEGLEDWGGDVYLLIEPGEFIDCRGLIIRLTHIYPGPSHLFG